MTREFAIVVATDEAGGIGRDGDLPWRLKEDLARFRALTTQGCAENTVIMGRRTWESLPERFRPLPKRRNVVLTRSADYPLPAGVARAADLASALADCPPAGRVFVIGGGEVYRAALTHPGCGWIHLTLVHGRFDCDTFLPELGEAFELAEHAGGGTEEGLSYEFRELRRAAPKG